MLAIKVEVKRGKLKEKYCRMSAYSVIHSLKLAQTDAFKLCACKSLFSFRYEQLSSRTLSYSFLG